jgi:glycosyltransferase involved in cell wall biosynthesis
MLPTISVITPSFNQGAFIEKTIQSVISQGISNLDYIIFDNLSNDQTLEILRRFETSLRWISEQDRGQAHAVNKGIVATKGEIIAWINSDDIYYPGTLATIQQFFQANPEVDVVYGNADHIDEQDQSIEAYYNEPWDFNRLKDVCYICQPATYFRRRIVEKYGLLDEELKYCMDYEYWLRLAQNGAVFHYLPVKLAGSRLYADTKTISSKVKVHQEINDMLKNRLGRVPDRWLFNYAHALLETRQLQRTKHIRFALAASALSVYAALRWNLAISYPMMQTALHWIRGSFRLAFSGENAR